jgi:hypothetical protein
VAGKVKRNPAAAGKIGQAKASAPKAAAKPLTGRKRRGELSQVQSDKLVMAKANLSLAKAGLAGSRERKARAGNALEKLKATESINNNQTRIRNAERTITSVNARAIPGRPINGRIGETMRSAGAKRTGAIKGSVPRNAGAASKIKPGTNLNAGKYKNIYINSANQKGKAAAKQAKAASRPDTAASNIPMRGARGRALNAEISRNVNAQKAASRAASKASGRQLKSDQSRAKKLREVHLGPLAAGYAQRSGRKVADVKAAIKGMAPSGQVKLFRQYVRENRATAKAAAKPAKAASKVDLSGAAFTARTRRAQSKLNAAQKDFSARGRSGSDTRSRKRVETLQSAVASLRTINSRAKRQGLPSSDIFKARAKRSTNPKLSPAEKAARTRQNKAAAKFQANVAAMERARRNR